jgi:hypothetical protein
MTYYNLSPDQQALYLATKPKTMVLVIPLSTQTQFSGFNLPLPIGSRIGLRETWAYTNKLYHHQPNYPKYVYKADYHPVKDIVTINSYKWLSSQCQPLESIRYKGRITSARVDRVQEIRSTDIQAMGIDIPDIIEDAFIDWFNARYSTPKPVRENGGIVGYRAYAWDWDSWIIFMSTKRGRVNFNWDGDNLKNLIWKGKPLEVIVNPWVQIATIEVEE